MIRQEGLQSSTSHRRPRIPVSVASPYSVYVSLKELGKGEPEWNKRTNSSTFKVRRLSFDRAQCELHSLQSSH